MITLGYALSSEEHEPNKLVAHAQMAERSGFKFLLISDHVYLHQVGPDQEGFLKFFKNELYPLLEKEDLVKETA